MTITHDHLHAQFDQAGRILEGVAQLKQRIAELEKENAELREATRWRNFKDEPPEHHQWIEACYCKDMTSERKTRIEIRRWDEGMKYDVFEQELFVGWRPLPKAPEAK